MEGSRWTILGGTRTTVRKKRSQISRRPKPESQAPSEGDDYSNASSTPPSDYISKESSDENAVFDADNFRRKEFPLNQCVSAVSHADGDEAQNITIKNQHEGDFWSFYGGEQVRTSHNMKHCSEGVLAPANWRSKNKDVQGLESELTNMNIGSGKSCQTQSLERQGAHVDELLNESSVSRVKIKVGNFTRTIQANSTSSGASVSEGMHSTKSPQSLDSAREQSFEGAFDNYRSIPDKRSGLQGVPWKEFSRSGFGLRKDDLPFGKMSGRNSTLKEGGIVKPVRKSKRVPKRRVLDGDFDADAEDDEIRYLEKLKTSKVTAGNKEVNDGSGRKTRKLSGISIIENEGASKSAVDLKKNRSKKSEDAEEDEESASDDEIEATRKGIQRDNSDESVKDGKREMTLTSRQRALRSGKDSSSSTQGASLVEFPDGLPPPAPRKKKEKLSEAELQLKKVEAAQRRRMLVEKAARESEAEAIRKILGQDSSRKKREEKIKKRQEELAQEKAAKSLSLAANTIRVVNGPNGTVVTFSEDMGFPSILNQNPRSYPPPREICAGPLCTNPYKYRDSKTKLPLCSFKCYKAVQGKTAAEIAAEASAKSATETPTKTITETTNTEAATKTTIGAANPAPTGITIEAITKTANEPITMVITETSTKTTIEATTETTEGATKITTGASIIAEPPAGTTAEATAKTAG